MRLPWPEGPRKSRVSTATADTRTRTRCASYSCLNSPRRTHVFCCNKEHAVHSCHLGDTGPPRAGLCNQVLAAHSPAHGGAGGGCPRGASRCPEVPGGSGDGGGDGRPPAVPHTSAPGEGSELSGCCKGAKVRLPAPVTGTRHLWSPDTSPPLVSARARGEAGRGGGGPTCARTARQLLLRAPPPGGAINPLISDQWCSIQRICSGRRDSSFEPGDL